MLSPSSDRQSFVIEYAGSISDAVLGVLREEGYDTREIIPGLIQAIFDAARDMPDPNGALDLAVQFLADEDLFERARG